MIDLNAIYDGGEHDGGTKPNATPAKKGPVDLGSLGETPSPVKFGETSDVNVQDYNKYLENGVYSDRPIDLIRGENQSVAEKIGVRLANFVPNVIAGTAEMIGYTGALATEWGDDRDYSNAFTEAGKAMRDPFGKTYARSNDVFALSDPTWWIDNVANLAETAVGFSGEVGLVGKGMASLAEGASKLIGAGAKLGRVIGAGAQLATAGFSAYTEAAQDGATVYDETYRTQLQKQLNAGADPETAHKQAQHIAAQSAATTVQLSTAMTTLLNLSSVAPFFKKSEDVVQDVLRNEVVQKVGEDSAAWVNRIKSLKADDYAKQLFDHHGMGEFVKEMAMEGGEEVEQQFAQQTGEDEGKKGKTHGFMEQLGQMEHFFDRTMNAQGALAFVLGAAGGGLQTALIHSVVPSKRSSIDKEGNDMPQAVNADGTLKFDTAGNPVFTTKLVTPRTYDEWSTRKTFNTARDMVAEDVSNFSKMQSTYLDAVKKGDNVAADKARTEMFNVANLNAITSGMTEPWTNTYQQIAGYDNEHSLDPNDENGPTEAMVRGYASDRKDSEYQAKANQAVSDLKDYSKEYDKLLKRYGANYESNAGIKSVVDMMFNRKVNLMANEKLIQHHEQEVQKLEKEHAELAKMSDPQNFDELEMKYDQSVTSAQEVSRRLVSDHKALTDAIDKKDTKTIKQLVAKYRAVGTDDSDLQGAVNNLADKIQRTNEYQKKKAADAEDNLFNGTGYRAWLESNPNGTYQQYRELVHRRYALDGPTQQYRANVDAAKAQHEIHASNYADAVNEKNVDRFAAKANKWQEQMMAEAAAVQAQKNIEISRTAKDKATAARLQALQMGAISEQYKQQLADAQGKLQSKTEALNKAKEELSKLSLLKDPLRYHALKQQIKNLNKEIRLLNAQIQHYGSLYQNSAVDTSTPDQDAGVDAITDQDNDLPQDSEVVDGPETPDLSATLPVAEPVDTTMVPPPTDNLEDFSSADGDTLEGMGHTQTSAQQFSSEMVGKPQEVIDRFNQIAEVFRRQMRETGKINLEGRRDILIKDLVPKFIRAANAAALLDMLKEAIEDEFDITPSAASGTTSSSAPTVADIERRRQNTLEDLTQLRSNRNTLPGDVGKWAANEWIDDPSDRDGIRATWRIVANTEQEAIDKINAKYDAELAALQSPVSDGTIVGKPVDPVTEIENKREADKKFLKQYLIDHIAPEYVPLLSLKGVKHPNNTIGEGWIDRYYDEQLKALATVTGKPVDIAPTPPPLDPIIDNADEEFPFALPEGDVRHAGKKIDNPISIANSTINFVEGFDKSNKAFFKAADNKTLNENLNWDILTPGKLGAGTAIRFEVDTDWDGEVNIDDHFAETSTGAKAKRADKFSDYLLEDGTINPEKIGDVPIKIVDVATGKKIGNVRREGWLMAKYPNTTDYLNFNNQTDEDGHESIAAARADLLRVRNFIVDSHNRNLPVEGKISGKGMGIPILNRQTNLNDTKKSVVKPELAINLLPDPTIQIGIVSAGQVYTAKGFPFDGPKGYDDVKLKDGAVVTLLPGSNGAHFYAPLQGHTLYETRYDSKGKLQFERKGPVQSVVRALELYLLHDGINKDVMKEMETIRSKTGFDISTAAGLRNFISQYYTYLDSFDTASIQPNAPVADGEEKVEKFVFNITDPVTSSKGLIHAGKTYSGVYAKANIINGKLNPDFVALLKQGFATRSRQVNYSREGVRGVNSSGSFTEINYNAAGNWSSKTHNSYNEYVKSWSKTAVDGRNQIPGGKYVYTANPQMPFEVSNINQPLKVDVRENTSPDTPDLSTALEVGPAPTERTADKEALDLILGELGLFNEKKVVHEIGEAPDNAKPLTVANLESIYGTTENRNGLTPQEVYDDLISRGHSFIADGYNPFSECL